MVDETMTLVIGTAMRRMTTEQVSWVHMMVSGIMFRRRWLDGAINNRGIAGEGSVLSLS